MKYYEEFTSIEKTTSRNKLIVIYGRIHQSPYSGMQVYSCACSTSSDTVVSPAYLDTLCRPVTKRAARLIDPSLVKRMGYKI